MHYRFSSILWKSSSTRIYIVNYNTTYKVEEEKEKGFSFLFGTSQSGPNSKDLLSYYIRTKSIQIYKLNTHSYLKVIYVNVANPLMSD